MRWIALAVLGLVGCAQILGIDDLEPDRGGGSLGGQAAGGDATGAGGSGATGTGGGSGACEGACGTPGCGTCPRAPTVTIASASGTFIIDEFEVTNAEYNAFLATNPSPSLAPATCAWNESYEPAVISQAAEQHGVDAGARPYDPTNCNQWKIDNGDDDRPVACVDWCDAAAYCKWAGKRLCGRVSDGKTYETTDMDQTLSPGDPVDTAIGQASEWQIACTNDGQNAYPYGASYAVGVCNDDDSKPEQVGSYTGCEGGYSGLFDMSGNVEEWDNGCTDYTGFDELQNCMVRGGNWFQDDPQLRCDSYHGLARYGIGNGVGIRCCADDG